jgi:cytochrome c-type biogenesis protein CcmH
LPDSARKAAALLAVLIIGPISAAVAMPSASPDSEPAIREGYEKVAKEVACWCGCARQSLYECTCGFAHQRREELEASLRTGKTPEELIAGLVAEHGEQVRFVPQAKGFNLLAWIGPGIVILLAGVGVVLVLLKWSSRPERAIRSVPTDDQEAERQIYRERLARDLSGLDR